MSDVFSEPFALVAHDAGAANHLFAWVREHQPLLCLSGPALALWLDRFKQTSQNLPLHPSISSQNLAAKIYLESRLEEVISQVTTVITGTGWGSNLEHTARKIAHQRRIRSIAVIDHWTNYPERFCRDGEQILPDEIWVTDLYAAKIARATFPSVQVNQQPNSYSQQFVEEVASFNSPSSATSNVRVLFVLEPIRHQWGDLTVPGEILSLDYFMAERHRARIPLSAEIRLRPHPSDPPGKYQEWLSRHANLRVKLDTSSTLSEAISWSSVVVGCQTYAMVLALACGRPVISSIPPWAPKCALPHYEILHLSSMSL